MFGVILIAAATLMHVYVFWRAATVPAFARRVPRRLLIAAGLLLWIGFVAARMLGHESSTEVARLLEAAGMTWVGILFLIFAAMLATDVVTGFGLLFPQRAPVLRGWALLAGVMLAAFALVQGYRPPVIERYEVELAGLPRELDGLVVAGISDLHLGRQHDAAQLADVVARVRTARPDLTVLVGDIFEGHGTIAPELPAILRGLVAPLGVWGVLGNHEFFGSARRSVRMNGEANAKVLRNRWVQLAPGLVLAGIDDLTAARRDGVTISLPRALAGRPAGATILLSHTPWQAETAAREGVGLMLSAHTHGGQIWPFSYLVRLVYPRIEGRYEVEGMTLIVCRGTGTWGTRMRLWRPGEIALITLRSPAAVDGR
jgi:uncharacterized protein